METRDINEALKVHGDLGGYLLDLGAVNGRHLYAVTDEPELYGRTPEQIAELNKNGWTEAP